MARRKAEVIEEPMLQRNLEPQRREDQLVALAYDLVERRLRDGSASSAETVYFLKMGTAKAKYETKLLEAQVQLATAKTQAIETEREGQATAQEALEAFKAYAPSAD
jgi:hypothetical protein